MNQTLRQQLENELRSQQAKLGVEFVKLQLLSATKELGLLEQIEVNYPSREVSEDVVVTYPDPLIPGVMKEAVVTRKTRVLMTEDEAIAYHSQMAEDDTIKRLAENPELVEAFLKRLKAPVPKKPATKGASKKSGGKKPKK